MNMKIAFISLFLIAGALCLQDADIINHRSIVSKINNDPESTWRAGYNEYLDGMTVAEFKNLLGVNSMSFPSNRSPQPRLSNDLPASFDSREKWPGCAENIRDQGECGSCWAYGCAEAIEDRFCIAGENVTLSTEQLVSCDTGSNGCQGGSPYGAWEFVSKQGIVTEECYPYEIPGCQHPCHSILPTPKCRTNNTCNDGTPFSDHLHFVEHVHHVGPDCDDIAGEIVANGPIEVTLAVYEDFPSYKQGVYQHKTGKLLGYHCVKAIGYGEENGVPYWLIANSWNTNWGDKGFFKILRGNDECGIEDSCVAGDVLSS